jgi:quercetin dioxygenase-like cupin family protein
MGFSVVRPEDLDWATRPHEPGEAPRHAAGLTDAAGLRHTRANLFRYEPGSRGRRHKDLSQDETFVPLHGTLVMYLDDPPQRHEVPVGGLIHVEAGTPLQVVNEGDADLVVFVYGAPPERGNAEFLDSAV